MTVMPPSHEQRQKPARVNRRQLVTFLQALEAAYSVSAAAKLAGPHVRSFYKVRDRDEAFAAAWERSYAIGTDVIRDEIRRRAVEGWEEPVYQAGKLVGTVRKFSDRLLELEAKRRDPAYRENHRVELTGSGGGPVELQAGYEPATLRDMLRLAGDLGLLEQLQGADVVDGEAVEEAPLALEEGSS